MGLSTETYTRMPRDFQRSKVYKWEYIFHTHPRNTKLTLKEAYKLVDKCIKLYDNIIPEYRKTPKISGLKRARKGLFGRWGRTTNQIQLAEGYFCKGVILHEVSHLIAYCMVGHFEAAHGPTFVRVLTLLLNKFMKIPIKVLTVTQECYKIKKED